MIKTPFLISIIALLASCTIIDTETDSAMSPSGPKEIRLSAEVQRTMAQSRAAIGENEPFYATILGWETTSDVTTYSDASPSWSTDTKESIIASPTKGSAVVFKNEQYYLTDGGKTFMKAFSPIGKVTGQLYTFGKIEADGSTDVLVSNEIFGTKSSAAPSLAFSHALTQLTFYIQKGESIPEGDMDDVRVIQLNGIQLPVGFDLTSKTLTVSETQNLYALNATTGNGVPIPKDKAVRAGGSVMIAPITGDAELSLTVVTNHGELNVSKVTSTTGNEFRAGISYDITLTFMRKEISSSATVTNWIKGEGGATVE